MRTMKAIREMLFKETLQIQVLWITAGGSNDAEIAKENVQNEIPWTGKKKVSKGFLISPSSEGVGSCALEAREPPGVRARKIKNKNIFSTFRPPSHQKSQRSPLKFG